MAKAKKTKKKDPRGGPGRNQGRKPQWDEKTATKSFRFPLSLIEKIDADPEANKTAYELLKKHYDQIIDTGFNGVQE